MSREFFTKSKTGFWNKLSSKLFYKSLIVSSVAFITLSTPLTVQATQFSGGQDGIEVSQLPPNSVSIRVLGPGEFFVETKSNFIQTPDGQLIPDGQYSYEVSGTDNNAGDADQVYSSQNDGRSGRDIRQAANRTAVKVLETGYFRISNGAVIIESAEEEQ